MGRPGEGFSLNQILAISASFLIGLVLVSGLFNAFSGDGEPVQFARSVGEPSEAFDGASVVAEVQGVNCEAPPEILESGDGPEDLLALWNTAVQSPGDACTPDFASTLGESWMMTDPIVSVLGEHGSLYEIVTSEDSLAGLTVFFVADDTDAGVGTELVEVVNHVWGADTIDWNNDCSTTDSDWIGLLATDGSDLSIRLCVA